MTSGNFGKKLVIAAVVVFVLGLVITSASAVGVIQWGDTDGSTTEKPKWVYECSGRVNVPLLSGDASLEGVSCVKRTCSWFNGLSILDGYITKNGRVSLVVGGQQVATQSWESLLGQDQAFTLSSSCVEEAAVTVNLYSDANVKIDEEAQVLA